MMLAPSSLRLHTLALPQSAKPIRHALAAFLAVFDLDEDFRDDVLTAIGEALANAIEHAYVGSEPRDVEVRAEYAPPHILSIDVHDRGMFIQRERQPNRGFGLRIVQAIAQKVRVETDDGTHVHMEFRTPIAS
jgi:serine/threonine-protein kinase RsbW